MSTTPLTTLQAPGAREKVYLRTKRAVVNFMVFMARTRPTQLVAPVPKGAEALALSNSSGDVVHLSGMNSRARTKQSSPVSRGHVSSVGSMPCRRAVCGIKGGGHTYVLK